MKTALRASIFVLSTFLYISCKKVQVLPPLATTEPATSITNTTATLNGTVNPNNSSTSLVFEYGLTDSYGQITVPTQSPLDGANTTNINTMITGLTSGLTYHFRLKTENSKGVVFGEDMSFTTTVSDLDGNGYSTVTIGTQVWMVENLKTTKYRNGDLIGTTNPATLNISGETSPKYQWAYQGDENLVVDYGRLYTWYTISDNRILAPDGWHVSTPDEWSTLIQYLIDNGYGAVSDIHDIAGSMASTSYWNSSNVIGSPGYDLINNNSSGFKANPAGQRDANSNFNSMNSSCSWWTSTEADSYNAYGRKMNYNRTYLTTLNYPKIFGFSVRCVRD